MFSTLLVHLFFFPKTREPHDKFSIFLSVSHSQNQNGECPCSKTPSFPVNVSQKLSPSSELSSKLFFSLPPKLLLLFSSKPPRESTLCCHSLSLPIAKKTCCLLIHSQLVSQLIHVLSMVPDSCAN